MNKFLLTAIAAMFSMHSFAADLPKVTILTNQGFVPFEWQDPKTKEWKGFDIDLINAIGKKAGFIPVMKPIDFDGIIPALQTHTYDAAIASMASTAKRAKVVDFSAPYYNTSLMLMVRADNKDIKGIKDLAGKSVGAVAGTSAQMFLQDNAPKSTKIVTYPNSVDMKFALMGGELQAVLHDTPNLEYFAKTKGKDKVKLLPKTYNGQPVAIAFAKGDKWLKPIDNALNELKADGTYQKIYGKYFGTK